MQKKRAVAKNSATALFDESRGNIATLRTVVDTQNERLRSNHLKQSQIVSIPE